MNSVQTHSLQRTEKDSLTLASVNVSGPWDSPTHVGEGTRGDPAHAISHSSS
jgi:hypothetical protein